MKRTPTRRHTRTRTSLDDARELLAESASPLEPEELSLDRALGCRLATPLTADIDQPPCDVSSMDGYAARAGDIQIGAPLPVAFEIQAGDAPRRLPEKTVARIFTGAPVPEGADTVVPQEQAAIDPPNAGAGAPATANPKALPEASPGASPAHRVRLEPLPAGRNIRRRGEIFAAAAEIARAGDILTPQRIAVAAAAGCARVRAVPRPRIAIISTGSELVGAGDRPGPGQIRDSNTPMLSAFARDAHLGVAYTAHATDDLDAVVNALDRALDEADVVVTAGGVSVGDYDLIPGALSSLGGETLFHGVDIKPGKPILVGRVRDAWFIGLPGNPVACLVEWRLFIRPLAEALAGDPRAFVEPHLRATLDAPLRNHGSRTLLHPCRLSRRDGGMRAEIRAWKGSHDVAGTASANALLRIEPDADLEAGAAAPVYALPWKDPVLE